MPDLKSVLAWSAVGAGVAIAAERRMSRMMADPDSPILDWELVRRTAYARSGGSGAEALEGTSETYDPLVSELVPLLAEACGTAGRTDFGAVRVVDRHGFIDQNLEMMRRLIGSLEASGGPLGAYRPNPLMRIPTSIYMGTLLGLMGKRVLGQYDPVLTFGAPAVGAPVLPPPALLIVEPNVRGFQQKTEVDLDSLRRWLMLHELTHAWQFETHSWLAPHLGAQIEELTKSPGGSSFSVNTLLEAARRVRPQLAIVGRIQATMAVLEGQGNYVMREVGQRHIPDFQSLDEAFHRRHEQPQPAERLVLWISGVGLKLQQYRQGEDFLRAIKKVGGQEALNRLWVGPEAMPGWREVRRPELWLERMGYQSPGGRVVPEPSPLPA